MKLWFVIDSSRTAFIAPCMEFRSEDAATILKKPSSKTLLNGFTRVALKTRFRVPSKGKLRWIYLYLRRASLECLRLSATHTTGLTTVSSLGRYLAAVRFYCFCALPRCLDKTAAN